ncbi:MAG: hypothetical protein DRQ39_08245, partial [Gammaproteobacteria bacterium]
MVAQPDLVDERWALGPAADTFDREQRHRVEERRPGIRVVGCAAVELVVVGYAEEQDVAGRIGRLAAAHADAFD